MARRPSSLRVWLALVLVAAAVGLTGGADGSVATLASTLNGATVLGPTGVEAAVVPARTEVGPAAGARSSPGRSFLPLLAAVLGLAGCLGVRSPRPSPLIASGRRPLTTRRCTIALRAPPHLQFA